MKALTNQYAKYLGLALVGLLGACGGNDDQLVSPYYTGLATLCGQALPTAQMPYQQKARGQDPSGAMLEILIYGDGSGNIGAIGELAIPNPQAIGLGFFDNSFGFNNGLNNNGYNNGYNNFAPGWNNGLNTSLNQGLLGGVINGNGACVSTNGISGFMETDGVADRLELQLQGANMTLVTGTMPPPTLNNQYVDGQWILNYGGQTVELSF